MAISSWLLVAIQRRNRIMKKTDQVGIKQDSINMGLSIGYHDNFQQMNGQFIFELTDADGNIIERFEKKNLITYDTGILSARLFKDPTEPVNGFNMLAVGTGATGALLSPDAPDRRQRKLNSEIARKAFSSKTFRDSTGAPVAYPTNIVDFTTVFSGSEAVGPLNEMGILSTISNNPLILNLNTDTFPTRDVTMDLSSYDILGNYLTFPVVSKPNGSNLTITWRITFG